MHRVRQLSCVQPTTFSAAHDSHPGLTDNLRQLPPQNAGGRDSQLSHSSVVYTNAMVILNRLAWYTTAIDSHPQATWHSNPNPSVTQMTAPVLIFGGADVQHAQSTEPLQARQSIASARQRPQDYHRVITKEKSEESIRSESVVEKRPSVMLSFLHSPYLWLRRLHIFNA